MALETMRDVKEINGFKVAQLDAMADRRPEEFIVVSHFNNGISFKLQDGPVKENGVNGCQVNDMISASVQIIEQLNGRFPCRHNDIALQKLTEALMWLDARTKDRTVRGVEGTSHA